MLENCKIKPAIVQIECHPYLQNDEIVEFCNKNQIRTFASSPLGDSNFSRNTLNNLLKEDILIDISKKYLKLPVQICLRWLYQRGIGSIPKAITDEQIVDYASVRIIY